MTAIALTIAGSDSGGGAGIQADLKAMSALGVYGASVITAITAQNTQGVTAVQGIDLPVVAAQIDAVLSDLDVGAIKIGMLATADIIETVSKGISGFEGPVVLDPVMVAKSGDALLQDEAVSALKEMLLPRSNVLTPNLPEAARLLGDAETESVEGAAQQGHKLCKTTNGAVLMKGGHASGDTCTDLLIGPEGEIARLSAPRLNTRNTHGTGCTLSSSIASGLAKNLTLNDAVAEAHAYLHAAIAAADTLNVGHGHGPVHHFHPFWSV